MIRELLIGKVDSYDTLIDNMKQMLIEYPQVKVTIEPVYLKRTTNQNKLYQTLVRRIVAQSGASEDYVRSYIKQDACDMGYPYQRDINGELVCDDKDNPLPLSSKEASISQMKILIETCYRVAQEFGFILEDAKE